MPTLHTDALVLDAHNRSLTAPGATTVVSVPTLRRVWAAVTAWLCGELRSGRAVNLLGAFHFSMRAFTLGIQVPQFALCDSFGATYGLLAAHKSTAGSKGAPPARFPFKAQATALGVSKDVLVVAANVLVACIGDAMAAGRQVQLDMEVGCLVADNRYVAFEFSKDLSMTPRLAHRPQPPPGKPATPTPATPHRAPSKPTRRHRSARAATAPSPRTKHVTTPAFSVDLASRKAPPPTTPLTSRHMQPVLNRFARTRASPFLHAAIKSPLNIVNRIGALYSPHASSIRLTAAGIEFVVAAGAGADPAPTPRGLASNERLSSPRALAESAKVAAVRHAETLPALGASASSGLPALPRAPWRRKFAHKEEFMPASYSMPAPPSSVLSRSAVVRSAARQDMLARRAAAATAHVEVRAVEADAADPVGGVPLLGTAYDPSVHARTLTTRDGSRVLSVASVTGTPVPKHPEGAAAALALALPPPRYGGREPSEKAEADAKATPQPPPVPALNLAALVQAHGAEPTPADTRRYWEYVQPGRTPDPMMHRGASSGPAPSDAEETIAPMRVVWMDAAMRLLPPAPGDAAGVTAANAVLSRELGTVQEDYVRSARQSILDYVLKDGAERARLGIPAPPSGPPTDWGWEATPPLPTPPDAWKARVAAARDAMSAYLHVGHGLTRTLWHQWHAECGGGQALLLVNLPASDLQALARLWNPVPVPAFEASHADYVAETQLRLMAEWHAPAADAVAGAPPGLLPTFNAILRAQLRAVTTSSVITLLTVFLRFAVRRQRHDLKTLVTTCRQRVRASAEREREAAAARAAAADAERARREEAAAAKLRVRQRMAERRQALKDKHKRVAEQPAKPGVGAPPRVAALQAPGSPRGLPPPAPHTPGVASDAVALSAASAFPGATPVAGDVDAGNVLREDRDGHDLVVPAALEAGLGLALGQAVVDMLASASAGGGGVSRATAHRRPLFVLNLAWDAAGDAPPSASPRHSATPGSPTPGPSTSDAPTFAFRPTPDEVQAAVGRVFDAVVAASGNVPALGQDGSPLPGVAADEPAVVYARRAVRSVVRRNLQDAAALLELYAPYEYLLSEEGRLAAFLAGGPSLEACEAVMERYRAAAEDIAAHLPGDLPLDLFLVRSSATNAQLTATTSALVSQVLAYITTKCSTLSAALFKQCKSMSARLLHRPSNSTELVEAEAAFDAVSEEQLPAVEAQAAHSRRLLDFLFAHDAELSSETLQAVHTMFERLHKMDSVVQKSSVLLTSSRASLELKLRQARARVQKDMEALGESVASFAAQADTSHVSSYCEQLGHMKDALEAGERAVADVHAEEDMLGWSTTEFSVVGATRRTLIPYYTLWHTYKELETKHTRWTKGALFPQHADAIAADAERIWRTLVRTGRLLGEASPPAAAVATTAVAKVDAFCAHLPLIHVVCNRGMKERHWKQVSDIVGFHIRPDTSSDLTKLLDLGLDDYIDQLAAISEAATREHAIESGLEAMVAAWGEQALTLKPYKLTGAVSLTGACADDVQSLLEDQLIRCHTMRGSPFADPVRAALDDHLGFLGRVRGVLELWLQVQAAWMYLERIFTSADLSRQMAPEAAKFKVVDDNWRFVLTLALADPRCATVANHPEVGPRLEEAAALLDDVNAGLLAYLERKRLLFPRFFFLTNDELLDILAQTEDPTRVVPHLKQLFAGIAALDFVGGDATIAGMASTEGEHVAFQDPVSTAAAHGRVEKWLSQVEAAMKATLASSVQGAVEDYGASARASWLARWPAQVLLAVNQLYWTRDVEAALGGGASDLAAYGDGLTRELEATVGMVRTATSLARATLCALIVIDVHKRDVVRELAAAGSPGADDFEWVSQLRYYWGEGALTVSMLAASLEYAHEYLGNSSRLVITPLTDRCYRTLMGAVHLQYGGAPEGPAGTGKTETVKDLAKALARQCIVFNCSEGLDHTSMAKFFKGLASAGSWSCFDEFNRIQLEVLSVVAQQITAIQQAIAARGTAFVFEGTTLQLNWNAHVFITMNPGYAGRAELPDNLKALFRTVAMMVPNYAMIAEIVLYSVGFVHARALARKIVATFRLCSEQLSSQSHYDYGMRAVTAVLRAAGALKAAQPSADEATLVLRSICDVNLPKFLPPDLPLFTGIVSDLFPGHDLPTPSRGALDAAVRRAASSLGLQPTEAFVRKVLQAYDTLLVRHGFMLVGRPYGGKSACLMTLAVALADCAAQGQVPCPLHAAHELPVAMYTINPKALSMGSLYGRYDDVSREWTNGVLARTFRACAGAAVGERPPEDAPATRPPSTPPPPRSPVVAGLGAVDFDAATGAAAPRVLLPDCVTPADVLCHAAVDAVDFALEDQDELKRRWIVFDGPVDTLWIENMNTVLDDTRKLCLMNGEIVHMSPVMAMIFEPMDLAAASPATVSRCGMVYLEPEQLGWAPVVASWMDTLPDVVRQPVNACVLTDMFEWLFAPAVAMTARTLAPHSVLPFGDVGAIGVAATMLRIMDSLMAAHLPAGAAAAPPPPPPARPPAGGGLHTRAPTPEAPTAKGYPGVTDKELHSWLEAMFLFALVWGLGGTLDGDGRRKFDNWLRYALNGDLTDVPRRRKVAIGFPLSGSVFDFKFDNAVKAKWINWAAFVDSSPAIPPGARLESIVVPTADTMRYTYHLDAAIAGRRHLLFVGGTGTGKTGYVRDRLGALCSGAAHLAADGDDGAPRTAYSEVVLAMSAATTALQAQSTLADGLVRRGRGVVGPPPGGVACVFVDDLNMPRPDVAGAQPPLELLRQVLDYGGWHSHVDLGWNVVEDTVVVGAMCPPSAGFNKVSPRLVRHMQVVAIPRQDDATLLRVFTVILQWHFKRQAFSAPVAAMARQLVMATLQVYQRAVRDLRPTPAKSHYLFNVRDFFRVVQGVCSLPPSAAGSDCGKVVRVWAHEILRVFSDRLVSDDDRGVVLGYIRELLHTVFSYDASTLLGHLRDPGAPSDGITLAHASRLVFGTFMGGGGEDGVYDEVLEPWMVPVGREAAAAATTPRRTVHAALNDHLADLNTMSGAAQTWLVLSEYAVGHVARVARVLRTPGGHALLIGVGGVGRQALTRLAAHVCGLGVTQLTLRRGAPADTWREDLKALCWSAGVDGVPSVLLYVDTKSTPPQFLEDVNNLLNAGEVPGLLSKQEKADAAEKVSSSAGAELRSAGAGRVPGGAPPPAAGGGDDDDLQAGAGGAPVAGFVASAVTPQQAYAHFVRRVRRNLHVVLCFSPLGGTLRDYLRSYPSLVNCCSVNWLPAWPTETLAHVAASSLEGLRGHLGDATVDGLGAVCVEVHTAVTALAAQYQTVHRRHAYVTPTSFTELMATYKRLLAARTARLQHDSDRYRSGVARLVATREAVTAMKARLEQLQPVLQASTEETQDVMTQVDDESREVETIRAGVAKEEAVAEAKAMEARAIKLECEGDLARAMPAVDAAIAALQSIRKEHLVEVKSMPSPPAPVKIVLEAVCVLLGVEPKRLKPDASKPHEVVLDYWEPAKRVLLSDPKLIQRLIDYDRDNIDPRVIRDVAPYLQLPEFEPEAVRKASLAASGIAAWVRAVVQYDRVAKVVAPKRARLEAAEAEYRGMLGSLSSKQGELERVERRLGRLADQLRACDERKHNLEFQMEFTNVKLGRAEQIISSVGGERERWEAVAAAREVALATTPGDVLLASAVVAYLGPFTSAMRRGALDAWHAALVREGVPVSPSFDMAAVLGDPLQVRAWNLAGLPVDAVSTQNALVVSNARRWPLMIDPHGQANAWVRNQEAGAGLVVTTPGDPALLHKVEAAVENGKPVLLEHVGEELPAALDALLLRQVFVKGNVAYLQLGRATLAYHNDFRLYMSTGLANPHYLPEVSTKVSLLNFTITTRGLADQLLGLAVRTERPDLEEEKSRLLASTASNRRQLEDIEARIVSLIATKGQADILDDSKTVEALTSSKLLADDIQEKQAVAEATEARIDALRGEYASVAATGSALFFAVSSLQHVDCMYKFSLRWFTAVFVEAIEAAEEGSTVAARCAHINAGFTREVFGRVCRSLFQAHRLLFSFVLAVRLGELETGAAPPDWRHLLTGGVASEEPPPNAAAAWLSDRGWGELHRLEASRGDLAGLTRSLEEDGAAWSAVAAAPSPAAVPLPASWRTGRYVDGVTRLCLTRALAPSKLVGDVKEFVGRSMGVGYTSFPAYSLPVSYAQSSPGVPLLFLLVPGCDPMADLAFFAESHRKKLVTLSLGSGQGAAAEAAVVRACHTGAWVVLQNCHLYGSWMPALERIVEALAGLPPGVAGEDGEGRGEAAAGGGGGDDAPGAAPGGGLLASGRPMDGVAAVHPGFRLWLTSYSTPAFPAAVVQACVKITNEPPAGLRANVLESFAKEPVSAGGFLDPPGCAEDFKRLLYGLCFFHAVVQERRSFGALGWNIPYEFTGSDLRISLRQLRLYMVDAAAGGRPPPYKTLAYLVGECNYGGRVTDDWDRRTLLAVLGKYFGEELHRPGFTFGGEGGFGMPPPGSVDDYREWLASMPPGAPPELFGLHPNADLVKHTLAASSLCDTLLATDLEAGGGVAAAVPASPKARGAAPPPPGGGLLPSEAAVEALAASILGRLPPPFDVDAAALKYPIVYAESMNTVLCQELGRFNALLAVVTATLADVRSAIQGLVVMTPGLEAVFQALFKGKVPAAWLAVSYPSLLPLGAYVTDLVARLKLLQGWVEDGAPASVWLPGLFFTQAFLTGVLQNFARRNAVAVDTLAFKTTVVGDALGASPPPTGAYIHGLFLEGAGWDADKRELRPPLPGRLFEPCPRLWLQPCVASVIETEASYLCPVYRTTARRGVLSTTGHSTNFIMAVELPTSQPPKTWIRMGVALMCAVP